ncbi:MAG TPA: DUF2987 domain-containing protein [Burkholderiaceae bacterium]|nr:DUF2987 domain-containing protein [Burkholderiaceae bacterium]
MFTLSALAEDREWVTYKKFVDTLYLQEFYNVPLAERDKVRLLVKVKPANANFKPSDLVLTIVYGGAKERLPISAEGILEAAPNPVWLQEDAMIYTNLPKGERSQVLSSMEAKVPDSLQFDYAYLMGSVTQWNRLIKEYAGMLRFEAPTFTGVEFEFSQPGQQSVQLLTKNGAQTFVANEKGYIDLKLDESLMKENPQLILSERPVSIGMNTD